MSVHDFFTSGNPDVQGLGKYLDSLSSEARIRAARELTGKEQGALYEAAKGAREISIEHFVPAAKKDLEEVIHYGKNSLAVFSEFQKRFCRPSDEAARKRGEIWGYNESGGFVKTFVGPGYFLAYDVNVGEVIVDYFQIPTAKPASWPEILVNGTRLSRFVYYQTRDTLRGVSDHLTIGRAARNGKDMDNWFVLCREG